MAGSLLYHMAMVTKMEAETRLLLQELASGAPSIEAQVWRFYADFASDVGELSRTLSVNVNLNEIVTSPLGTGEKIYI